MALLSIKNIALKGIASCVPKKVEDNSSLKVFKGDEAEKFSASTGIYRRRVAEKDSTTSDLCYHAAEKILESLYWEKESVECLIFVTQTPDYILPATSCILQDRLGLSVETYTLDISLGCSGWVYGLATISQIMSASGMKRGLLLVGDTITKFCSKDDKSSYPLFGDAGTATAFEYLEGSEFKIHTATDGSGYRAIIIPEGGYREVVNESSLNKINYEEGITRNGVELALNGLDVFVFGISKVPQSVNLLLDKIGVERDKVDYFLFHQANMFMNEKIRKKLKLIPEQVPYSLENFGNTSSATIPLTMTVKIREQLEKEKLKLIACGFGVGLSWATVYFETDGIVCPELIEI